MKSTAGLVASGLAILSFLSCHIAWRAGATAIAIIGALITVAWGWKFLPWYEPPVQFVLCGVLFSHTHSWLIRRSPEAYGFRFLGYGNVTGVLLVVAAQVAMWVYWFR